MQQQPLSRFRDFVQKPLGRGLLIALAILVVVGAYGYLQQPILAIPALLIFGLGLPIWLGIKRPRYLAIAGIVIILIAAPLSGLPIAQSLRAPITPATSLTDLPGTNGHALLANATVSPYTGSTSTNFTWTVTVDPAGIPTGNTTPVLLYLYISTCPGATSGTSPPTWCSAGYPFIQLNGSSQIPTPFNHSVTATFHYQIGSNGIWDWQMGVYTFNNTTHKGFYQNLVGDPQYNALEGPVVGDYATTYSELLPLILTTSLVYLALPYYLVLLLYMFFKSRERRRKETAARAAGPVPPTGSAPPGAGTPPLGGRKGGAPPPASEAAPAVPERACPNCNAVVYENETSCWKCGANLRSGSPLPSSSSPPPPK